MATGGYTVDPEFASIVHQTTGTASSLRRFANDLSAGKEVTIRVSPSDQSMAPFIQPGDAMVFGPCTLENTKAGDIVLYRYQDRAVARRVVRRTILNGEAVVVTKSDSSPTLDPPVKVAAVFGRLVRIERQGKSIRASSLNRGLMDVLTDYGSKSVSQKLLGALLTLLPNSMRPDRG